MLWEWITQALNEMLNIKCFLRTYFRQKMWFFPSRIYEIWLVFHTKVRRQFFSSDADQTPSRFVGEIRMGSDGQTE